MRTVHLVRHGEVDNPTNVIYGRLPGFRLSERGRRQAQAASARLADANVTLVIASPMERAQETAAAIAAPHGIEVSTDDRLIESGTTLEGVGRTLKELLRSPGHWWSLRNPLSPSWGESFADIRRRTMASIMEAFDRTDGEIVIVSHQTPVLVARLALARRGVPPWLSFMPCGTGSVTTITLEDGKVVEASYFAASV